MVYTDVPILFCRSLMAKTDGRSIHGDGRSSPHSCEKELPFNRSTTECGRTNPSKACSRAARREIVELNQCIYCRGFNLGQESVYTVYYKHLQIVLQKKWSKCLSKDTRYLHEIIVLSRLLSLKRQWGKRSDLMHHRLPHARLKHDMSSKMSSCIEKCGNTSTV
jgi:hypothetical protein